MMVFSSDVILSSRSFEIVFSLVIISSISSSLKVETASKLDTEVFKSSFSSFKVLIFFLSFRSSCNILFDAFSDAISLFSISISDIINSNTMVKPNSVFFITTPLFFFIIWLCLDGLSLVFLYQMDVERLRL